MRILITGKNGQVGQCLVKQLEKNSNIVFLALGRDELDITKGEQVEQIVTKFQPDVIINAAAYTAVDKAEQECELAYAINRDGPMNLALSSNKNNAILIHISTDYVFSGDKNGLYGESDITNPQGVYGQSKLDGEKAIEQHCKRHVILRTAWVFGEYGNNFVKTMLRLASSRNTLGVVADQFGGPSYAGDIASTLIKIAKYTLDTNSDFGMYHYSGFPHVSWYQFAESIFKNALVQGILEHDMQVNPITTEEYPTPAKRPENSSLDCNKLRKTFGVEASDWKKALTNLQEYQQ